jgi:hypothetical protein
MIHRFILDSAVPAGVSASVLPRSATTSDRRVTIGRYHLFGFPRPATIF